MSTYLGDFPASATVYVPFSTFASTGASVTISNFAVGDILVYKDGSATQRSSTAGYTLLDTDGVDFDGVTGIHGFSIDTSDNTDAGFYAAGHEYQIAVGPITCDNQTLNFWVATFSIERAGGALAILKSVTYGLSAIQTALGTVDGIVDAILTDTGTTLPAAIAAIPDPTVAISATQATSVASGSLAVQTYHTFSQAITSTSTAALNTATKIWLAAKTRASDTDAQAQVFIEAAGGLTVLAGAAYTTTGHGTLVLTGSSGAWVLTAGLDEVATGMLTAGWYQAEIKALVDDSTVSVWNGVMVVSAGIVRTVT